MRHQNAVYSKTGVKIASYFYSQPVKLFVFSSSSDRQPSLSKEERKGILRKALSFINQNYPTLQHIRLGYVEINDQVVDVLSEFKFDYLQSIDLKKSNIGQAGIRKLVDRQWPTLYRIQLEQNMIGNTGLRILFSSQLQQQLQDIRVGQNGITSDGLRGFQSACFPNLMSLHLGRNNIGLIGIKHLVRSQFPILQQLNLCFCELTNQSIKYLCTADWFYLNALYIYGNDGLTPQCLVHLEGANWILNKTLTYFQKKLCIYYFSTIAWPSTEQGKAIIQTSLLKDEIVQGNQALMNANVRFSRF